MKKAVTVVALVSIIAVCMVVVFKNLAPVEDDGYVPARERAIIKKFDADGDGTLNPEERQTADAAIAAAKDREKAAWIKKFDKDGDGELNKEERAAAGKAAEVRKAAIIKKFDADGDGKLNKEEETAARKATARQ